MIGVGKSKPRWLQIERGEESDTWVISRRDGREIAFPGDTLVHELWVQHVSDGDVDFSIGRPATRKMVVTTCSGFEEPASWDSFLVYLEDECRFLVDKETEHLLMEPAFLMTNGLHTGLVSFYEARTLRLAGWWSAGFVNEPGTGMAFRAITSDERSVLG